jgi:hypothetical protein
MIGNLVVLYSLYFINVRAWYMVFYAAIHTFFWIYFERPLFTQKNIPQEHFRAYLMRVLHFLQASTFLVRVCGLSVGGVHRCVCCWTICELWNYSEWSVEIRGSKHKNQFI